MSKGHRLVANASWMYGSQIATVVVQMAYAAVTSRLVGAEGFAAYGVALAVGALTLLLANGGLGQAVGRMNLLDAARVRSLTAYAIILGALGAGVLYATSSFWASVWGAPAAGEPLRLMSLSVLISPLLGLGTGLLRRQGSFRLLSIAIFMSNSAGMLLGVGAVFLFRSATALLVSNIAAQFLLMTACIAVNRGLLFGSLRMPNIAKEDLSFSWKLTAATLVGYFNGNIGKFAVSNLLPAGSLGFWNRADVVTTVPFMQVQNAIIQAVYPEFRHDLKKGTRASSAWLDLLTVVAWLAFPASAVACVVVPPIAALLFGPGWGQAVALSGPLALVAGIQIVSTVLASAIEALAKFKWIWTSQLVLLFIYVSAAAWCFWVRDWYPIMVGLFAAQTIQHVLHVVLCSRAGYLDSSVLLKRYARIVVLSTFLALAASAIRLGVEAGSYIWTLSVASSGLLISAAVVWKWRFRLEPLQIIQKYRNH